MKKSTNMMLLALALFVAAFAAACPERRTIADIQANPSKYNDKEVVIVGTVKDSYGLNVPGTPIRGGVYKVDDGTYLVYGLVFLFGVQIILLFCEQIIEDKHSSTYIWLSVMNRMVSSRIILLYCPQRAASWACEGASILLNTSR
jgi:hypothetical protein